MLRGIELEILATVESGETISELATKLGRSESYVSRAVTGLEEKHLVDTHREGRLKRIVPSDARAVEVYRDLVRQHAHIDFAELLTGKALESLYYLDEPRTVTKIAELSDNYRNTINRVLKRLRDRGIVGTHKGYYHFNGDFDQLHDFARELVHHQHRQRLESVAPNGSILWEGREEFLAMTDTEIDEKHFHETGLARFAVFDLQFLLTRHRYYFFSEGLETISPEELCCHTLLIDDETRYRSYCLLLLSHVDIDEHHLRERAIKYDLKHDIEAMLHYLSMNGEIESDRFPDWTKFQALAADYGVSLNQ